MSLITNAELAENAITFYKNLMTNEEGLVQQMVGEPVKKFYGESANTVTSEVVLKLEDFTRWGFFHHVNFESLFFGS